MTEAEWLACADPQPMLRLLGDRLTPRKARLWACAAARCIWQHLTLPEWRQAVEVAERFAEGQADARALQAAHAAVRGSHSGAVVELLLETVGFLRGYITAVAVYPDDRIVGHCGSSVQLHLAHSQFPEDAPAQAALLRDIVGALAFRPLSRLIAAWLAWEGGTVPKLAASIYEERAFDRLPILADALEEAGCDAAELLTHLRGPGPHVRGCWAVDLVLGKP
jgi:hypothetical protein